VELVEAGANEGGLLLLEEVLLAGRWSGLHGCRWARGGLPEVADSAAGRCSVVVVGVVVGDGDGDGDGSERREGQRGRSHDMTIINNFGNLGRSSRAI
jgi:hypothetical protein